MNTRDIWVIQDLTEAIRELVKALQEKTPKGPEPDRDYTIKGIDYHTVDGKEYRVG